MLPLPAIWTILYHVSRGGAKRWHPWCGHHTGKPGLSQSGLTMVFEGRFRTPHTSFSFAIDRSRFVAARENAAHARF